MEKLIEAMERIGDLEWILQVLKEYDTDGNTDVSVEEIADYLNDEASYAAE